MPSSPKGDVDALVAHAPGRLRLSPPVRVTENTEPLLVGSRLWRTIRGRSPGGQYFTDPERGQVAYWGVVEELRGPRDLRGRIKVEGRLIGEIETLVVRGGAYVQPQAIERPAPSLHEVVAQEDRASREELIKVANLHFDGIGAQ